VIATIVLRGRSFDSEEVSRERSLWIE